MNNLTRLTIGVLAGWPFYDTFNTYNFLESNFLDSVLRGIRVAADYYQCHLLVGCGIGSGRADEVVRPAWPLATAENSFVPISSNNTNGLIVFNPLISAERSRHIQQLRQAGHPVVFLGTAEEGSAVALDNEGGIRQALQHLVEHGHRAIGFIAGHPNDETGDGGERLRAYHKFVRELGLEQDPRLVQYGFHSIWGGEQGVQALLNSGVRCTAVLASNDESAIGVMNVLHKLGFHIPQDMAVIGFDNRPAASAQEPPLTAVNISTFERGYRAVELLVGLMQRPTPPDEHIIINSSTHLVVRQSCGCKPYDLFEQRVQTAAYLPPETEPSLILNKIARPILSEARRLGSATLYGMCRQLFEAFELSLQQKSVVPFRRTLEVILEEIRQAGENGVAWQMAIATLGEHFATRPGVGEESQRLIRTLLNWAHTTISEQRQRDDRAYILTQSWQASRIATLNAHLVEVKTLAEIWAVLERHLPTVEISQATLVYFQGELDPAGGELLVQPILNPAGAAGCVPLASYSPLSHLPPGRCYHLSLFPLFVDRQQVGFIVYETENFAICEIITRQVAAALRSVRLYQQAEEGRRLAEEANQMKSRFLSMVSHELRTPLSLVVGLSEMLVQDSRQGQLPLDPGRTRQIAQIYTSAQHLDGLIQDVLDLTRGDINQLVFEPEPLVLQEVLAPSLAIGEQMAADKKLVWRVALAEHPLPVYGDRGRLRQVVLNLINNAIKFTAEGVVQVTIQANSEGTWAEVVVQDSGLGVPEGERETIFEPFQQSQRTAQRGYGGLGLGLAICKHFVGLHKGELGLRPGAAGEKGATFYVRLPLLPISWPSVPVPTALPVSNPAEPYVLVVEPPHLPLQTLITHLRTEGYQTQVVTDEGGEGILATIEQAPPRAIVLDARLPVQQGWRLFQYLKSHSQTKEIPVLFYALEQGANQGGMLTFEYMSKPLNTAELGQLLAQLRPLDNRPGESFTILIVDDDPAILEMHTQMVQRQWPFYAVRQAKNGREALADMAEHLPNLVLLDLMMPELDGFELLAIMRQQEALRQVPVIVLTANVLTEAEMERLQRGVSTVLKKGVFTVEETLHHIQNALDKAHKLGDEKRRLVRQAMAYIHERFTEPITREDISAYVGVSEGYLSRTFQDELGLAPINYLNRYRVNQAKRLLLEGTQTITEIAHTIGFPDSNYFSRVFRREVGVSPKEFRRRSAE